jgi:hypothetical protein
MISGKPFTPDRLEMAELPNLGAVLNIRVNDQNYVAKIVELEHLLECDEQGTCMSQRFLAKVLSLDPAKREPRLERALNWIIENRDQLIDQVTVHYKWID